MVLSFDNNLNVERTNIYLLHYPDEPHFLLTYKYLKLGCNFFFSFYNLFAPLAALYYNCNFNLKLRSDSLLVPEAKSTCQTTSTKA